MLRAVFLEPVPFDFERDLITPTFKLKRPQLLKYYKVLCPALTFKFERCSFGTHVMNPIWSDACLYMVHDTMQGRIDEMYTEAKGAMQNGCK